MLNLKELERNLDIVLDNETTESLTNWLNDKRFLEHKQNMIEEGYFNLKVIDGKLCGLYRFAFTTGLVVDLTECEYSHRYCYSNLSDAKEALEKYLNTEEHPTGPWIKMKGSKGELSNPNLESNK